MPPRGEGAWHRAQTDDVNQSKSPLPRTGARRQGAQREAREFKRTPDGMQGREERGRGHAAESLPLSRSRAEMGCCAYAAASRLAVRAVTAGTANAHWWWARSVVLIVPVAHRRAQSCSLLLTALRCSCGGPIGGMGSPRGGVQRSGYSALGRDRAGCPLWSQ